jgi:xanthine dehydrogenase accessory factor
MKLALIEELATLAARRQPAALITDLASGAQRIETATTATGAVADAIAADKSGEIEIDGRKCFALVRNPSPRIIIVGAVHITQALAPMATLAGYDVVIVDPRGAFATAERFPGTTLSQDWPDEALAALQPDTRSAVVTLTHDPKLDDPALAVALRSPAFYIGSLGSKKTHASRIARLRELGFGDNEIARIHGPAGLDIGAKSPAEIAVSVLAQLTAARHQKPTAR